MARLARIQIICHRYPLETPLRTVFGIVEARPALILRIEDTTGAHGYGEIWCNFPAPGAEYRARLAAAVLPNALGDFDSDDPWRSFTHVRQRLHALSLQAGEGGPADQISAGVDIAIHDLAARRSGVPLATHLGGAPRPLKPYASGIGPADLDRLLPVSIASGFAAFKLRIGFGHENDLAAIEAARHLVGEDRELMIDANQNWNAGEALAMIAALRGKPVLWLEEPLPADRPEDEWMRLWSSTDIPIAGGENISGTQNFEHAIGKGYLDVVQPDICKWGGLSHCMPLTAAILANGRRYCPHYLGGGVGLAASAHLLAAAGGDGLLEVDVNENGLREALAGPILPLRNGIVDVPNAPGLGYEPDLASVSDLRTEHFDIRIPS